MAIDYQKLDNWQRAQKTFSKIVGKDNFKLVSKKLKLFVPLEKLIKDSDKVSAKIVKLNKKDKHAAIPMEMASKLRENNTEITKAGKKLEKLLDKNLDDQYDKAIEDLVEELELYKLIYASFTKLRMDGKKEDLEKLQKRLDLTIQFLKPGSFDKAFDKGNNALQEMARKLRAFTKDKDNMADDDIRTLYNDYNKTLPTNGNGMRSVTTFLKAFVDLEMYFEKYKISNSSFKKLKLHPELKDYDTFRKYLKGATVFIKKLTPWASANNNALKGDYVENKILEGKDAVIEDIATRLKTGKRTFIQAKTFFAKLF